MPDEASNKNTELLIRLDEKMGEVLRRMGEQDVAIAAVRTSSNIEHEGFNRRITTLESFRWWLLGASAVLGILFSLLKDWLTNH